MNFSFLPLPSSPPKHFIMCKFNPPKKKKKFNSEKSKRVWQVLELVEATLLPPLPKILDMSIII
jgi:hypothetical protein